MSEPSWATLLEVTNRIEAEIIKDALEAQGIPAEIFQEGAIRYAYPMVFGPLAKVEICVPNNRMDEAKAWLTEYENGQIDELPDETGDENLEDETSE